MILSPEARAIVDRADLLAMAKAIANIAPVSRREYAGPCPFCGGRDRFHVVLGGDGRRDTWLCGTCTQRRQRDAIAFIQHRDRVSFRHALAILGAGPSNVDRQLPAVEDVEPDLWSQEMLEAVDAAEERLWSPLGQAALEYLRGRGLERETILAARLGFVHQGFGHGFRYGAGTKSGPQGEQRIPGAAIVIPWWERGRSMKWGRLTAVKLRFLTPVERERNGQTVLERYGAIAGSRPVLYGAEALTGKPNAALAEGEFDTLLLRQEAGDLVDVVTMGPDVPDFSDEVLCQLVHVKRLFCVYDTDAPSEAAAAKMCGRYGRVVVRARPPVPEGVGKDIGDAWRAGADLRAWVEQLLQAYPARC